MKHVHKVGYLLALLMVMTLVLTITQAQADSPKDPRIVGGQVAAEGAWPWQAMIAPGQSLCGGSLIATEWVLTAAHCFFDQQNTPIPAEQVTVTLGAHDINVDESSQQKIQAKDVFVHQSYDPNGNDNDIALIHLFTPATLNDRVKLVSLITANDEATLAAVGTLGTVTGWGATSEGGDSSNVLKQVSLAIVSNQTCNEVYGGSITDNMLCAGGIPEGGQDSCQGDSGGPYVVPDGAGSFKQAGVVSFGEGCAKPNIPGVYARVSRYNAWINSTMGEPTPTATTASGEPTATDVPSEPTATTEPTATHVPGQDYYIYLPLIVKGGSVINPTDTPEATATDPSTEPTATATDPGTDPTDTPEATATDPNIDPTDTPEATATEPTATATLPSTGGLEADSGFRPNPNGYKFANYGTSDFKATDLDAGSLIDLFGAQNVCQAGSTAKDCVLTAAARTWREKEVEGMNGGHCAGLAITSQRFYAGYDTLTDFGVNSVQDFNLDENSSNHISKWFTTQSLEPANGNGAGWIAQYGQKEPNEILQMISNHMKQTPNVILYMGIRGAEGGHAINPYKIENKGNGVYWLYVYDNNYPNTERYITFDTNANTWLYAFAATNPAEPTGAWQGNAQSKTQRLRPATIFNQGLWACPFCEQPAGRAAINHVEFKLTGVGKLLITDQQQHRIGWDFNTNQDVNEIPGGEIAKIEGGKIEGGEVLDVAPLYKLPKPVSTAPYQIYITGDTIDNPVQADLMMTAPGFAVGLENLSLNPGHELRLTISPDGRQITFNASEEGSFSPDIYFAVDPDPNGDSYLFDVSGFDLPYQKTVTATLDLTQNSLHFEDDDGATDTYEIGVMRIKADGTEQAYINNDVGLNHDEDGELDFANWDGSGDMSFDIEGTTVTYNNEEVELNVTVQGQGEVYVSEDAPYLPGQQVTLYPIAEDGWAFSGWSGDATNNADPLDVTLDSNKNITAIFVQQ